MKDLVPWFIDYEVEVMRGSNPKHRDAFFQKLAWDMISCEEALVTFPDMQICPVCLARISDDGSTFVHRSPLELFN